MIKEDYKKLLNTHDWHYARASGSTYDQGRRQREYLIQLASTTAEYMAMFIAERDRKAGS
tara:strand:- start:439 stop:618 length:180 start_codon:yes stop_codon:yes gene_type:complete